MTLDSILSEVYRKAYDYSRTGRARPLWLQKEIRAIHLMETDFTQGLILLGDGLKDEQEALREAL